MSVQLSADGLWIEGTMYTGQPQDSRFAIPKSAVLATQEATWMTDSSGNPISVTQIFAGQTNVNALATYDEVMAILSP